MENIKLWLAENDFIDIPIIRANGVIGLEKSLSDVLEKYSKAQHRAIQANKKK